ncbi:MAG: HD domain-containing protein [Muribaculaceae bacterium]|nr:HD domain-containing protein [Muribaculaceae bacterium]
MDTQKIIDKYYNDNSRLRTILTVHSRLVADKALECARRSGIVCDLNFVEEAAMLHDIGIFKCNAPDIFCFGDKPYICHGIEGRQILEEEGLARHAPVCERHTGSGLTIDDIKSQKLPLPLRDMTPQSIEEKLICYADKFFSKSGDIRAEKSLERVMKSMEKHGPESLERFRALHELFKSR